MCRKLRITDRKLVLSEAEGSKLSNRCAGFTFTEVIMASALLVVAIVPILRALTSAQVTSSIVERRTLSLIFAQGKLDEIQASSIYHYDDSYAETDSSVQGSYLCNVVDSTISVYLRQITVSVGYDFDGDTVLDAGEIEVTLATLIARRW